MDIALSCVLGHDLEDLLLLGIREFVPLQVEILELCLPGQEDEQRTQASIPIEEPMLLLSDGEALQPVEVVVG